MHYCYIIYSKNIDKFYIGETENFEKRLKEHNSAVFNKAFTKQTDDWQKFLIIECISRTQARKLENFIKKMKSKKFIFKLKENFNIIHDIIQKLD